MSPGSSRRRGRTRWLAAGAAGLVVAVYLANLSFYAGQTFESGLKWRMEHGRLTVSRRPANQGRPKRFWVDLDAEGMRWRPEGRLAGPDDWSVTMPLWIPLGLCLAWCAVAWRRRAAPGSAGS